MLKPGQNNQYCVTYQEDLHPITLPEDVPQITSVDSLKECYDEGFALPKAKKIRRFTQDQLDFVEEKFFAGQASGNKLQPPVTAKLMREEKINGKLRFLRNDWLSEEQINSLYSRFAAKLRNEKNPKKKNKPIDDQEMEEAQADLQNLSELQAKEELLDRVNESLENSLECCPLTVSFSCFLVEVFPANFHIFSYRLIGLICAHCLKILQ